MAEAKMMDLGLMQKDKEEAAGEEIENVKEEVVVEVEVE